jgi:hypothetical protein
MGLYIQPAEILDFAIEVITYIGIGILILLCVILVIYLTFLPTFTAYKRRHKHKEVILILNILGIGWLIVLIWACFGETEAPPFVSPEKRGSRIKGLIVFALVTICIISFARALSNNGIQSAHTYQVPATNSAYIPLMPKKTKKKSPFLQLFSGE